MKKPLALAISAAALAFTSAAMADDPKEGGVVNTIIQPSRQPGAGHDSKRPYRTVAGNIYEGLLRYTTDLEPMPQLAESWEVSEDGRTYTSICVKALPGTMVKPLPPMTSCSPPMSSTAS